MNRYFQKKSIVPIFLFIFGISLALFISGFSGLFPKDSKDDFSKEDFFIRKSGQESGKEDIKVVLEIADTQKKRDLGLMNRVELEDGLDGMLFVFNQDVQSAFWMKDTLIPLSLAFINKEGIIQEIIDMEPCSPKDKDMDKEGCPIYSPKEKFRYGIEVKQGFFAKNNLEPGDIVLGLRPE